ncbi:MAG: RNHCP domain-containing protein [Candidatus Gracilibacteria bacterium]
MKKEMHKRNEPFTCIFCGKDVQPATKSSRNHCPYCLHSLHVDESTPGDRQSLCEGIMQPTGVQFNGKKQQYQIEFTCEKCHHKHMNILADDDDAGLIGELMAKSNMRTVESKRHTK